MPRIFFACLFALALITNGCKTLAIDPAFNNQVNVPADSITFAVIGDYGRNTVQEDSVAKMVKSWGVDFIITVGDNNYTMGSASTINDNIGKYYGDYIFNPDAPADQRCNGKATKGRMNRFFPAPGNHDNYSLPPLQPYLNYFTLPGDEKNYEFTWGPVHFFSMNTKKDGNISCCNTDEAKWLTDAIAKNTKPFKFVYFHHPPYSSGEHGSSTDMRWPFTEWGVDAVFSGHEHFYAKVKDHTVNNPIYFICGSSGSNEHYHCNDHPLDANRFEFDCDNVHFGAMKVKVKATQAVFEYYAVEMPDSPTDVYVINK
jgi:hypothetical protein